MHRITAIVIGAGLLLVSAAAAAETYRWVDSEGKVHYSDRPTQGSKQVDVRVPGQAAAQPTTPQTEDAGADSSKPVEGDDVAQVRNEQCALARKRLQSYEDSDRLYEEDEAGGKRELSIDERIDMIVKARQAVKKLCDAPNN